MPIIDGKHIASQIQSELQTKISFLKEKGIVPTLAIVQVGNNSASNVYVRNKVNTSERLGVKTIVKNFDESSSTEEIINEVNRLNNDSNINGILVQLPLPKHMNEKLIVESVSAKKDVDCFHVENVGLLWTGKKQDVVIKPCTPAGVIELLKRLNVKISGEDVVIIGRSNIVGKPLAALFNLEDATVTIAHSKTKNLKNLCKNANIVVVAIGNPKFINQEYTNPDQVMIDVGINHDSTGKLCGDIDFESVVNKCKLITPVPGGVGPMTIAMLMDNLIKVTELQKGIK